MLRITLIPGSGYFRNNDAIDLVQTVGQTGMVNRLQLPIDSVPEGKYQELQPMLSDMGLELILEFNAHNLLGSQRSVALRRAFEATANGRREQPARVCPRDPRLLEELAGLTAANPLFSFTERVHISYFRYENARQCVCDDCIREFTQHAAERGLEWEFAGMPSIFEPRIFETWTNWRSGVLQQFIGQVRSNIDRTISVEIDYDQSKQYLLGPQIEEGLRFEGISTAADEIYLHIEPLTHPSSYDFSTRETQEASFYNSVRALCHSNHDCEITPFFWHLGNDHQLASNLPIITNLAMRLQISDLALYSNQPLKLVANLENSLSY